MIRCPTLGSLTPRIRVKMGYEDTFVMGDATKTNFIQIYRTNAVWDPDYTGTGVTVTGYSTFSALYGRYFVHHAQVEVTAEVRDSSAITVNAENVMVGCSITDGVPASPNAGAYDSELGTANYKLRYMPRGTTGGGIYRFNHNKLARSTVGNGVPGAGGSINRYAGRAQGPTAYRFKDRRSFKLDDPLATLTTGGFIEHEQEGEFPLTAAYNATPIDNMFLGCWAYSLPMDNVSVKPLPYIYWTVQMVLDVEWYAPVGIPAATTAAAGAGAGLDAAMP